MKKLLIGAILLIIIAAAATAYRLANRSTAAPDEHAGLYGNRDPLLGAMQSALVGRWQSSEDGLFIREFRADGSVTDSYGGEVNVSATGTWRVFTDKNPDPAFSGTLEQGVPYLVIVMDGSSLHFKITKATPEELELIYLGRGGILVFKKIN